VVKVAPQGEEVLVRPSLSGLSTTVFDHTVWVHDQNVCVSPYGYFWARLGSSEGTHFAADDDSAEVSPMATEAEV
ncbi:hypothetical protein A2U01_0043292, partial [Trifolium medium]|nr:hypothetical protein [Trifolium medium]